VIEPTAPATRRARITRALGPLAVLGLLSGALAVAGPGGGGGSGEADPLPLLAGAGTRQGEAAALSMVPASDGAGSTMPAPWGGLEIRVAGDLPDLGTQALAWEVLTPDLDAGGVARMARALGLEGQPVRRDGGWVLETAGGNLSVWPSQPGWSVNFYRSDGVSGGDRSRDGEAKARRLLEEMGVLEGEWRVEASETEVRAGMACAVPEIAKVAAADGGVAPPDGPASSPACPPPPPPVPVVSVTFHPVLDGRRADWGAWGVTLGPGDAVQSLWGTWARLQRKGDYELRPVPAALDELRSGGHGGIRPMTAVDVAAPPMPCPPAEAVAMEAAKDKDLSYPVDHCVQPEPRVVTITGVELGLLPAPGWDGERNRLYLVPAYRFAGRFEDGSRYEAPVIALAPGAIAPPRPMPKPVPGPEAVPAPEPRRLPAPTPTD
jgi:hypothetical protein